MGRIYVIFAVLWGVSFVSYAQKNSSSNEVPNENETYPYTGQVVDILGNPIKDVLVKNFSTNSSMTTEDDGLYSFELPVPNDSIVFIKNGERLCGGLLSSYNKYYLVLDSTRYTLLPYTEYTQTVGKTNYKAGLRYLNKNSKEAPENTKAFEYIKRAAGMGNQDAMFDLAQMYEEGIGVTQNYGEAFLLYNNLNNSKAKTRLGVMYLEGLGVKQNDKKAAYYFYRAYIEDDNATAKKYLKEILAKREFTINNLKTYKFDKNKDIDAISFPSEKNAMFPGGDKACLEWLSKHIIYPKDCEKQGIQGHVLTKFTLDIDGSIIDLEVLSSPHPSLAKEAVRVISKMPKWKPAIKEGKTVCSTFLMPITFRFGDSTPVVIPNNKESGVELTVENFPDMKFREWLSKQGYGIDGVLTDAEIKKVEHINVAKEEIKNLKGIEYFKNLKSLVCSDNQLSALDVSNNTQLEILQCYGNKLSTLDVSKNVALEEIRCHFNHLTSLDVSNNIALEKLWCHSNQLTTLCVAKNSALTELYCYSNQLTTLDVSNNPNLTGLFCESNKLITLDVSNNQALIRLHCHQNQIKDEAMDALIESLPTVENRKMSVIYQSPVEQNLMTAAQVAAARSKGWLPYYYNGSKWVELKK